MASLTTHIRHTRGFSSLDLAQTGDLPSLSSTLYGVRFTYGSQKRSLFAEISRLDTKTPTETNRRDQHALGASFRVLENLWVTFVTGRRKQFVNDKLDSVVDHRMPSRLSRQLSSNAGVAIGVLAILALGAWMIFYEIHRQAGAGAYVDGSAPCSAGSTTAVLRTPEHRRAEPLALELAKTVYG